MQIRFQQDSDTVTREVAGQMLLVPVRGRLADMQNLYVPEGVGEFIWGRLETPQSEEELLTAILDEFDVEREEAARDLGVFLSELTDRGLVKRVGDDSVPG